MKILLPLLAILFLFAMSRLEAKILVLDGNRVLKDGSKDLLGEVSTRESSPAYQNEASAKLGDAFARLRNWLASDELATIGPLAIGLALLIVPIPFSRSKLSLRDGRSQASDNNLRRIGQSWDPRF